MQSPEQSGYRPLNQEFSPMSPSETIGLSAFRRAHGGGNRLASWLAVLAMGCLASGQESALGIGRPTHLAEFATAGESLQSEALKQIRAIGGEVKRNDNGDITWIK